MSFFFDAMLVFAALLVICITILYFYSVKNYDYWVKRNVAHVKPLPLWGSYLTGIFKLRTATESATMLYNMFPNEKLIGYFNGRIRGLLVKDPEMLKHIFVTDFDHFHERTTTVNEDEPFFINLFHSSGDYWRLLRQRLTPAFTVNKLQKMYPLILNCAKRLQTLGDEIVIKDGVVDAYEIMSRFTMEFICNCGMGVDINILMDENSKFFKLTSETFKISLWQTIIINIVRDFIPLLKWIRTRIIVNSLTKRVITDIVLKVCEKRNYKPSDRHDFVDLILGIAAMGKIKGVSTEKKNSDGSPAEIEIDLLDPTLLIAQVCVFFSAGYETSALTSSYTLHQLAYHPEIQREIQEEIDSILSKNHNKLCYEAVAEMSLLENAIYESLRLLPPGGVINRTCKKKYTFPGTNITVDPGVDIVVSVAAMHTDEKYFPDPYQFNPDRFKPEAVKERNKNVYFPFGLGKRMCIGSRLGLMQAMVGLAALLQRFSLELAPQSRRDIKLNRTCQIVQGIKGGLPIKLVPRTSSL